jgi:hypothetical protein
MGDNAAPSSKDEDMTASIVEGKDSISNGKADGVQERSSESIASSPEHEAEPFPPENQQAQKRKGGRKPVSHRRRSSSSSHGELC